MRLLISILTLALTATSLQAAQLYRWVDDKGRVEWRDTPPPGSAGKVEQRNVSGNTIDTTVTPYSLQQAVKNFPVTLWIYDCGGPCDQARAHLERRGVPHDEKNAQTDNALFNKVTGGSKNVPVLFVGSTRLDGYLPSDWDSTLDAAGYLRTAAVKPKAKPAPAKPAPPPVEAPRAEAGAPEAQK
jgi:hypothetical protein